jgi:CBS domain containing-hemolysin-like protein
MILIFGLILIIIILIFLSSFFAAAEMSFVSLDKISLLKEIEKGTYKSKIIEKLYKKPNETISAIVVCNNLVNISASILAGLISTNYFGDVGVGIATALMTFLVVVFGESIPKAYGINNYRFFLISVRYINFIRLVFYPIAWGLSIISNSFIKIIGKEIKQNAIVTEEEIRTMLSIGVKEGSIKKDEKKMVEEIFDFDETKVIEIYTPYNKIIGINKNDTIQDLKKLVVKTGHSRFPVFNKKKQIVGVVYLKDALLKDKDIILESIMKSILKISPNMKVDNVLRKMQKKKVHMAILETKKDKILGLVTMEDLIEEVFGEIKDEHD